MGETTLIQSSDLLDLFKDFHLKKKCKSIGHLLRIIRPQGAQTMLNIYISLSSELRVNTDAIFHSSLTFLFSNQRVGDP